MHDDAGVILLAAGQSTRFGSDKRLATVNGQPMCLASASIYIECGCHVVMVLQAGEREAFAKLLSPQARNQITLVENSRGQVTQSESLTTGLRWLERETRSDYALIALADMPYIQAATVNYLLNNLTDAELVALEYLGAIGHPRAIHRNLFSAATAIAGDHGAKHLFAANSEHSMQKLPCDDAAILRDVDYPTDLA